MPLANPQLTKFTTASPVLATFSFQELTSGQSFLSLFPMRQEDSSSIKNSLVSQILISNPLATGSSAATGSFTKIIDLDFDALINQNFDIAGNAKVNLVHGARSYSPSRTAEYYTIVKVRRWDGSTETDLGSVQTVTHTYASGAGSNFFSWKQESLDISLSESRINTGEFLRVTFEVWAKQGSNSVNIVIVHDPDNNVTGVDDNSQFINMTDGGTITWPSKTIINIPLKIDI